MQRQRALAHSPFAGADGDEMAHSGEPLGDAGALPGHLLEDPGPSVAGDVVIALHVADLSLHRAAGALTVILEWATDSATAVMVPLTDDS
jgi:hypothetical protein